MILLTIVIDSLTFLVIIKRLDIYSLAFVMIHKIPYECLQMVANECYEITSVRIIVNSSYSF